MTKTPDASRGPTLADRLLKAAGLPNINARQYGVRDLLIEASRALAETGEPNRINALRVTLSSIVTLAQSAPADRKTMLVIEKAATHSLNRDKDHASPAAPGDAVGTTIEPRLPERLHSDVIDFITGAIPLLPRLPEREQGRQLIARMKTTPVDLDYQRPNIPATREAALSGIEVTAISGPSPSPSVLSENSRPQGDGSDEERQGDELKGDAKVEGHEVSPVRLMPNDTERPVNDELNARAAMFEILRTEPIETIPSFLKPHAPLGVPGDKRDT
jgi:hypothetical protein